MEFDQMLSLIGMVFVFSIPILAILTSLAKYKVKVRAEQQALQVSNQELEQKLERLQRASAETARRLENLETIVVSQAWSALQEPSSPPFAATRPHELQAAAAEERNRQRAAELAERLGR
jgi:hypothetical protein